MFKLALIQMFIEGGNKTKNLNHAKELINEAEDTMTILRKYIDGLDANVDKKQLTSVISSLYNQALYIDV